MAYVQSINNFVDHHLSAKNKNKYNTAIQQFQEIEKLIKKHVTYDVSRVYLSGSLGKGTALDLHFDIDIVVFITADGLNDFVSSRPFVLKEIDQIISRNFGFSDLREISVSFNYDRFKFDILIGADFKMRHQMNECSNIIARSQKPERTAFNLHTSVCEFGNSFISYRSPFVKRLIMLCKYWCRIRVGREVTAKGRSSMIELIAMHVGLKFEDVSEDLCLAFRSFLQCCSQYGDIGIEFDSPPLKYLYGSPVFNRPYVIEPTNPYNNRANCFDSNEWRIFSQIASSTLIILERCLKDGRNEVLIEFLRKMYLPSIPLREGFTPLFNQYQSAGMQKSLQRNDFSCCSVLLGIVLILFVIYWLFFRN